MLILLINLEGWSVCNTYILTAFDALHGVQIYSDTAMADWIQARAIDRGAP